MGKRTKYQFKTRQAAEDAYREQGLDYHRQMRLARALYDGSVRWLFKKHNYRLGVFDETTNGEPRFVIVFEPKTGQQPDLVVVDMFDTAKAETYRPSLPMSRGYNAEEQALVELLQEMILARYENARTARAAYLASQETATIG